MSTLNPKAIATLGIGFGPVLVAYLGMWPVSDVTPPDTGLPWGPGPITITQPSRQQGFADDRELLELVPIIVEVLNARR